jgi:DNA-binding MarR family transcriptional regulator
MPLTVPSAARRLGITRQAVQRTVNELTDDGLIRLAPNPDHRTAALVELTDHGRDVLARITLRATNVHRQFTAAIPTADIVQARDVLQRLVTHVRATEHETSA